MVKKQAPIRRIFTIGSLTQWAWTIYLIVTLPLIVAIIYTSLEVTDYTQNSQKTLFQTVKAFERSQDFQKTIIEMERNIRQFQVLSDLGPDLYEGKDLTDYMENRNKFLLDLESLKKQFLDKQARSLLQTIVLIEEQLFIDISNNVADNEQKISTLDLTVFDHLTSLVKDLVSNSEKKVGSEAAKLSETAQHVGLKLKYSAIASIPITLILAVIFVKIITRPLKDLGRAIRNLGEEGFEKPISIRGTKDLTEIGQHLEWLRQKLNELEFEKQQFIRNVSHELKTPLATLKEGTDLLSENVVGVLNTEQQDIIHLMKMGNITINDLVQNLLEYQRTISTKVEMNYSNFELRILIERMTNEYELLLRSKNITLDNQLSDIKVRADHDKLRVIISNLFSNAVKFSPQNSTIGLTLISHDDNIIQFIIEDQGPSIEKELESIIFKDFYQGESAKGWKIKASGLGLALVKHYLQAHKGSIKLLDANKQYCGARFSLLLPQ